MKVTKTSPRADVLIKSKNPFPVVGIGASAGGLDAFRKLLSAIPNDSGMAFVLVQHLDPNHESILTELLQKATELLVSEITNDVQVEPDHVYIIPSNKMLIANDGVLLLSPRPVKNRKDRNLPIDLFFASLAEIHQSHAIGVVLSGTASDGTAGLKAIKDQGGLTFAQDETSAAYPGMPASAARAGVVDYILEPQAIPAKILEVNRERLKTSKVLRKNTSQSIDTTNEILLKVRERKGTDFLNYKQTTIGRRILRRMTSLKKESVNDYLNFLNENNEEIDALYQDFLIPVTSFFRDPKSFSFVSDTIVPLLLKQKKASGMVRIWVAGCSTGEEAYSLAMSFIESTGSTSTKIQLFGTDLSDPAIAKARMGKYSSKEVAGISASRLKRFFIKEKDSFIVNKQLREVCVFARHDFLKDPPFINMDIISCRNVLIYMEPVLQKKALTAFHYALNENGVLFMGKTETTNSVPDFYKLVKKNEKIYTAVAGQVKYKPGAAIRNQSNGSTLLRNTKERTAHSDYPNTDAAMMLSRYSPSGVVVDGALQIVHFIGSTSKYLEQSPGAPDLNLVRMARRGLGFELRTLVHRSKNIKGSVVKENILFKDAKGDCEVSVEVIPLPDVPDHYLVLFQDSHPVNRKRTLADQNKSQLFTNKDNTEARDIRIVELETELAQTHEDMRKITDDQEATNEVLQSDNEELLSSSEELQSLNEELETSKEELQSSNEELLGANQEMVTLNEQLKAARNYSEAIIATTRDSLLVLDKSLRIKTANNSFYDTFRVSQAETEGTMIYDLGNKEWDIPSLRALLDKVFTGNIFFDFEVTQTFTTIGYRTMLLNGREMSGENKERLILLSIQDVTEKVKARNRIEELQLKYAHELEANVLLRTSELTVANDSLEQKNDELEVMNKELDSFTYISSHDMQEPLRKIQTYADRILSSEHLSENGAGDFRKIQSSAIRMRRLIDDLLAFSRLGNSEIKFENTDIGTILNEVLVELKDTIAEKKAVIEIGELCSAYVIPFQLHQLLFNLISNALKFSKPGVIPVISVKSVNITYSRKNNANLAIGKEYCHLIVTDNGIGFEPHYSAKIFEVFQRLHSRSSYEGTGIGLAIVKKIVENHKGVVIATGEIGKGASFDIYFPVDPSAL